MTKKRILSLLLAVAVVAQWVPFFSFEAMAAPQNPREEQQLLPGEILLGKKAAPTGEPNEFLITWQLEGQPLSEGEPSKVVFLLDCSASERDSGRFAKHKELLTQLLPQILAPGSENQVALLLVDDQVTVTELTGQQSLGSLLEQLEQAGTSSVPHGDLEEGLRQAERITSAHPDVTVVLLSGGTAGYSSRLSHLTVTITCAEGAPQKWELEPVYLSPRERLGDGTDPVAGLPAYRKKVLATSCNLSHPISWHKVPQTTYPLEHGQTMVFQSSQILKAGGQLLVISVGGSSSSWLDQMSTERPPITNYQEAVERLIEGFVPLETPAFTSGIITEQLNPLLLAQKDSLNLSTGTATLGQGALVWEPEATKGTMTILVTLDVESPDFKENHWYPLGEGVLSYRDPSGAHKQQNTPATEGMGSYSQIYRMGILTDEQGNFLDNDRQPVGEEQQAMVVGARIPLLNNRGVNQWAPGRRVLVDAESLVIEEGYLPLEAGATQLVELPKEPVTAVAYFYYVEEKAPPVPTYSYQIHHLLVGETEPFETQVIREVGAGTVVEELRPSEKTPLGYKMLPVADLPVTISDDSTVLLVEYQKEMLPYTITYYEEGEQLTQIFGEVWAGEGSLETIPEPPPNYQVTRIFLNDQEQRGFPIPITGEANQIAVHCKKNQLPPTSYTYQIQHLLVGETDPFETQVIREVAVGTVVEELRPSSKIPLGYRMLPVAGLPVIITDDSTVILVEYEKIMLPYTITYYYGAEEITTSHKAWAGAPTVEIFPELREGYQLSQLLFGGKALSEPFVAGITSEVNQIQIFCEKEEESEPEDLFLELEYLYEGLVHPKKGDAFIQRLPGTPTSWNPQWGWPQTGYQLAESPTIPPLPAVLESGKLQIVYRLETTTQLDYTVNTYQNGLLISEEEHQLPQGESLLTYRPDPDQFVGYQLSGVAFHDEFGELLAEDPLALEVEIRFWRQEVSVYYQENPTPPETSYSYTLEHYLDGQRADDCTKSYQQTSPRLTTADLALATIDGYAIEEITPPLPFDLTGGETIRVYYRSNQPPDPEETTMIPVVSQLGETLFWDSQVRLPVGQSVQLWSRFASVEHQGIPLQLETLLVREEQIPLQQNLVPEKPMVLGDSGLSLGHSGAEPDSPDTSQLIPQATQRSQWIQHSIDPGESFVFEPGRRYELLLSYKKAVEPPIPELPDPKPDPPTTTPGQTSGSGEYTSGGKSQQRDQSNSLPPSTRTVQQNVEIRSGGKGEQPLTPSRGVLEFSDKAPTSPLPLTGAVDPKRWAVTRFWTVLVGLSQLALLYLLRQTKKEDEP